MVSTLDMGSHPVLGHIASGSFRLSPEAEGPAITGRSNVSSDSEGMGAAEDLDFIELKELCQMALHNAPEDSEKRCQKLLNIKTKG